MTPSPDLKAIPETPPHTATFASLGLLPALLRALSDEGYTVPTPIQAQAIPVVLQGRDVLAAAQTGTGKTAAFALPLLQRLHAAAPALPPPANGRPPFLRRPVRTLILTPTRELAAQVEESIRVYGKHLPLTSTVVFGGVSINAQIEALRRGVDVLVATPGRLLDHVSQRTVDLSRVEILVLDEADRMLDMGFIRDIRKILALLPARRQNLLFSATFSDDIKALADGLLNAPTRVEVARANAETELVTQSAYMVVRDAKRALLAHLIESQNIPQALVFTRTKHGADRLAKQLVRDGIEAVPIHGDRSQGQRTRALADFKAGQARILVATDIAARGLDIDQLPHVFNFELPNIPEDYVHRIGRTGRAGSPGDAVSLVSEDELKYLADIEKLIKKRIPRRQAEGFIAPPPAPAFGAAFHGDSEGRRHNPPRSQGQNAGRPARPPRDPQSADRPRSNGSRPNSGVSGRPDSKNPNQGQPANRPRRPNVPRPTLSGDNPFRAS